MDVIDPSKPRGAEATLPGPAPAADGRPRFAAFLNTLDEMDILPAAILHLRQIGVDVFYVFDFGSTDGTLEFLAEAENDGDIWVLHIRPDDPVEVLNEARVALTRAAEVDWVLLLDTDEFWLPASGTLRDLGQLADRDILLVPRYNVVVTDGEPAMPLAEGPLAPSDVLLHAMPIADLRRHLEERPDGAWIEGIQMPSVMARRAAVQGIAPGDHGVLSQSDGELRQAYARDLIVAHVPFRSLERFERKAANVVKSVEGTPDWFSDTQGWQWLRWARMHAAGELAQEYERQQTPAAELRRRLATGEVRSAGSIMTALLPRLDSDAAFEVAAKRSQPWLSAAALALDSSGIPAGANLRVAGKGQYPTVIMHPDHVIKLYGTAKHGHTAADSEIAALRLLGASGELPVPRLLAEGELAKGWRYIIESKVPGVPLSDVRQGLADDEVRKVARWLGRFLRDMHAFDPGEDVLAQAGRHFRRFVERRYADLPAGLADGRALPERLIDQVEAWMPSLPTLLPEGARLAPLHTDLHDEHVLGHGASGSFHPAGVIDFNRFRIGSPMYELGPMWNWLFRGDAHLLRAVVREAGMADVDDPSFPRMALAWCLLHQGVAQFPSPIPGIRRFRSLDHLAQATFGASG